MVKLDVNFSEDRRTCPAAAVTVAISRCLTQAADQNARKPSPNSTVLCWPNVVSAAGGVQGFCAEIDQMGSAMSIANCSKRDGIVYEVASYWTPSEVLISLVPFYMDSLACSGLSASGNSLSLFGSPN